MAGQGEEPESGEEVSRRDVLKIGVMTAAGAAIGGTLGFLGGGLSRQQEIDSLRAQVANFTQVLKLPTPLATSISMYNWSLYTNYALLDEFVDKFKIQMVYDDSAQTQEDFRSRLQLGNPDNFDLMIVTGYAVEESIQLGLLEPLNPDFIPNIANLDPNYPTPWDPTHAYSLPYLWGTTGIGWNTLLTQLPPGETVHSWSQLFDTSPGGFLEQNQGRVTIQADRDEALSAAAIYLQSQGIGGGVNDLSQSTLDAVRDLLIEVKPFLAQFADAEQYYNGLSGNPPDFHVSHAWSGDVLFVREATPKPEITYTIPDEGAVIWTDNFVIPKDAPNRDTAMVFINYLWEAANAAILAMFRNYGIANRMAIFGGPKSQEQFTTNEEPYGMILPYVWGLPDYNILVSDPPDPRTPKLQTLRARTTAENDQLAAIWDAIQAA